MELLRAITLIAATVATGLMAGLFFAFSVAVMPGLAGADDRTFVGAMQRMNVAILNGWFGFAFFGSLVFTVLAAALHAGGESRSALPWLVAGVILYAAVITITFVINVPLNDQLAAAGEPDAVADLAAVRERFEARWVQWNMVRTVLSSAAFGCLTWALVLYGRAISG